MASAPKLLTEMLPESQARLECLQGLDNEVVGCGQPPQFPLFIPLPIHPVISLSIVRAGGSNLTSATLRQRIELWSPLSRGRRQSKESRGSWRARDMSWPYSGSDLLFSSCLAREPLNLM